MHDRRNDLGATLEQQQALPSSRGRVIAAVTAAHALLVLFGRSRVPQHLRPSLYKYGIGSDLTLSDRSVQQVAGTTLTREDLPAHVLGWHVAQGTGARDSRTAVVRVSAVVHPPVLGGVMSSVFGDVHITVQSRAVAHVH